MRAQPSESDSLLVKNGHLVTPSESIDPGWLLVENGRIADLGEGPGPDEAATGANVLDAGDAYVVPGLIDTHVCGMLGSRAAARRATRRLSAWRLCRNARPSRRQGRRSVKGPPMVLVRTRPWPAAAGADRRRASVNPAPPPPSKRRLWRW